MTPRPAGTGCHQGGIDRGCKSLIRLSQAVTACRAMSLKNHWLRDRDMGGVTGSNPVSPTNSERERRSPRASPFCFARPGPDRRTPDRRSPGRSRRAGRRRRGSIGARHTAAFSRQTRDFPGRGHRSRSPQRPSLFRHGRQALRWLSLPSLACGLSAFVVANCLLHRAFLGRAGPRWNN